LSPLPGIAHISARFCWLVVLRFDFSLPYLPRLLAAGAILILIRLAAIGQFRLFTDGGVNNGSEGRCGASEGDLLGSQPFWW